MLLDASAETADLIDAWRRVIVGDGKGWVVFEHGTSVIFTNPSGDLRDRACAILREWGPVHAGSSAGDFSVIELRDAPGWVVTSHHPDVFTYVSPGDVGPNASDLEVGFVGRSRRNLDAESLHVIHVEIRAAAGRTN
jgi:hypothetical protein